MTPAVVVDTRRSRDLLAEPRDAVLVSLAEAETVLLSSCCLSKLDRHHFTPRRGAGELDHLLDVFAVEVAAFTADQAAWRRGLARFGKGATPPG